MKNRDSNQGDEVKKMEDYVFVDHSVCKSELTLTGYYDTNGVFVIAGYFDRHGKFVEDDKLPVNIKKLIIISLENKVFICKFEKIVKGEQIKR